jgi:hypothetical protein
MEVRILQSPLGSKTSNIIIWIATLSINFSTWYFKASNRVYNITTGKETEICEYNDFSPFTFAFFISSGGYGSPCAEVLKVYTSQSVLVQSWIY